MNYLERVRVEREVGKKTIEIMRNVENDEYDNQEIEKEIKELVEELDIDD
jgi:hypothetical protein